MNLVVYEVQKVVDQWPGSSTLMLKYPTKFNLNVDSIIEVDLETDLLHSKIFLKSGHFKHFLMVFFTII